MAGKEYYLKIQGRLIPVSEEVYKAYYCAHRLEFTYEEKDARNGLLHYSDFDTEFATGEEMIETAAETSVEEEVISKLMCELLHRCLNVLPSEELKLIKALYFEQKTERQLSRETGIPQKTINNRRKKAIADLKKIIEKAK